MISINTNISSITAQANLSKIQTDFNTAMTRLSSGLRINSAADDAAGMAIGAQMTSQVQGMNMAVSNANQGKNLVNTAESANQGVASMLHRVRELAVQSASDTNTAVDRQALTAEANQLIQEINSVAQNTTWNGMKVLDGSFTGKQLQIGADQGQSLNIDIDSASATKIGANVIRSTVSLVTDKTTATGIAAGTTLNVSGHSGSEAVTTIAGESAKALASAINAVTASTGVAARASTVASLSNVSATGTLSFSIGTVKGGNVSVGTVNISDTSDLTALRDAINTVSGQTGIVATMGDTNSEIRLTDSTGGDIKITSFSSTTATMAVKALNSDGSVDDAALAAQSATLDSVGATGATSATLTGQVTLTSTQAFSVASSVNATDGSTFFTSANNSSSLHSVAEVSLATAKGAAEAITVIDTALQKIDQSSSNLGAISNRLDSTISNLTAMSTNVDAAKSLVMDADFAKESTALARSQVLSQAATAMLAQANSSKQNVLSLLK